MILQIQNLRSGAGASFLAASLSWHFSHMRRKVLALSISASSAPLELYFNIPIPCRDGWLTSVREGCSPFDALWRYTPSLYVLPLGSGEFADSRWNSRSLQVEVCCRLIREALDRGFSDIVVDAGNGSAPQQNWAAGIVSALADVIFTVGEPDAGCLMTLAGKELHAKESVVLNKVRPESSSMKEAKEFLEVLPVVSDHLAPVDIPFDDLALEASFLKQPIAQTMPDAASSRTITSLGCWARRLVKRPAAREGYSS